MEIKKINLWVVAFSAVGIFLTVPANSIWAQDAQPESVPKITATLTATIVGPGKLSPNDNGKSLVVGQNYTIHAIPNPGCVFSNWVEAISTNDTTITTAKLTFPMVSNLSLTATFKDITAPTLKFTTKASSTSNSVATIIGTAKDNVGVASVWCQAGSSGWVLASSPNAYTNWTAVVVLASGANTISAYAEDATGNRSATETVTLTDAATGAAAGTLTGTSLQLAATNGESAALSFGSATFAQFGNNGPQTGIGTYAYTLIDANTASLVHQYNGLFSDGTNGDTFTLFFTTTTSGTWTNVDTNSGTFTLGPASNSVPATLSGLTLLGTNTTTNVYAFTNQYGDGIFTTTNSSGSSSGTYMVEQFSPSVLLVEEDVTAGANSGTTNFDLLNFSAASNIYYVNSVNGTNVLATNVGSFTIGGQETSGFLGPVSLAGLSAAVTEVKQNGKRQSFVISFGAGNYGQFVATSNFDAGIGTYIFSRTGPKIGTFLNQFLAPPTEAADSGGDVVSFYFINSHAANFTNSEGHGTITFSVPAVTAPASLVNRKITGGNGGFAFANGTFVGLNHDSSESGTYSYSAYGPQAGFVVFNYTDSADAGTTEYVTLWFSSANGGSYREEGSQGNVHTGSFTLK